jgi:hypothetical protein
MGSLGSSSWPAKVTPRGFSGSAILAMAGFVEIWSGIERGTDDGELPAKVSPRDLGIAKMRTWVGMVLVSGLAQAYKGETEVLMFRPRRAVR